MMKKFVPYERMSKKAKKEVNKAKHKQWSDYGCLSPVSKVVQDKRKKRNKEQCRMFCVVETGL